MPSGFLSETYLHKQWIRTSEGTLNLRHLISKRIPCKESQETQLSWLRVPPKCSYLEKFFASVAGGSVGLFFLCFHRGLWFERGFSWFPASCIVKKICNLNRHKAFWYSDAWAWTKISVRLVFTSAYVSLETDISRGLMLAIAYTPKACFLSPLP